MDFPICPRGPIVGPLLQEHPDSGNQDTTAHQTQKDD